MHHGLIAIVGTGTGIGKTHTTCALATALVARGLQVRAYKPVESGVIDGFAEDIQALASVSNALQRGPTELLLPDPISPHLAARRACATLDLEVVIAGLEALRQEVIVLLELPGGLFSPLTETALPGDLLARLRPEATVLVAPDRLGVLHDLGATTRAAKADGIPLTGIVFSAPALADASTGFNAPEVGKVSALPVLANLPRQTVAELAKTEEVRALVSKLLGDDAAALEA